MKIDVETARHSKSGVPNSILLNITVPTGAQGEFLDCEDKNEPLEVEFYVDLTVDQAWELAQSLLVHVHKIDETKEEPYDAVGTPVNLGTHKTLFGPEGALECARRMAGEG